jgi:hypothetical protein
MSARGGRGMGQKAFEICFQKMKQDRKKRHKREKDYIRSHVKAIFKNVRNPGECLISSTRQSFLLSVLIELENR